MQFYTLGMAGHIDHGKTTLTKALTQVDTDRLKEEKERGISIELGYAPFPLGEFHTSIVDVPGHERFIRQMIAGVAGIDLVLLVVAADEGVMPQTREHLEILSFLGIEHGIIVVTKIDKVEEELLELVEDDIREAVKHTIFEKADIAFVDGVSGKGIDQLKELIGAELRTIPQRNANGTFRLPIDHVFTLQGQGRIVRGTIYEGAVRSGDLLRLLPHDVAVKARQLQSHGTEREQAIAGQRVAINISAPGKQIKRGDVLVAAEGMSLTRCIDLSFHAVGRLLSPLKQRAPIKLYTGTTEVMGTIVFFDRNELKAGEEALCQVRFEHDVVVRRGDRFVIRRPSPVETIGGGWIIDPSASRYRFGQTTIAMLEKKRVGTPQERLLDVLNAKTLLARDELFQYASLSAEEGTDALNVLLHSGEAIEIGPESYTSKHAYELAAERLKAQVLQYHQLYPLRYGMNKAECIQALKTTVPKRLAEAVLDGEIERGSFVRRKQFVAASEFQPSFPSSWKKRMEQAIEGLRQDGLTVRVWEDYAAIGKLPAAESSELRHYLIESGTAFELDDKMIIHSDGVGAHAGRLYHDTNGKAFGTQEAKASLEASRKHLIPFLELLDTLGWTRREGDGRVWLRQPSTLSF